MVKNVFKKYYICAFFSMQTKIVIFNKLLFTYTTPNLCGLHLGLPLTPYLCTHIIARLP